MREWSRTNVSNVDAPNALRGVITSMDVQLRELTTAVKLLGEGRVAVADNQPLPTSGGVSDHGALTGLGDDDHAQYLLLAGRTGGQTVNATVATDNLLTLVRPSSGASTTGSILLLKTGSSEHWRFGMGGSGWPILTQGPSTGQLNFAQQATHASIYCGGSNGPYLIVSKNSSSGAAPSLTFGDTGSGKAVTLAGKLDTYINSPALVSIDGANQSSIISETDDCLRIVRRSSTQSGHAIRLLTENRTQNLFTVSINGTVSAITGNGSNTLTMNPGSLLFGASDTGGGTMNLNTTSLAFRNTSSAQTTTITGDNKLVLGNFARSELLTLDSTGIKLKGSTSGYITINPAAVTTDHTLTLPAANATGVLTNNGSGALSWAAASSSNTLLDGSAHSDTVAQTVSRGSLVYGNSTPKWDELAVGTANTVLKSDGTDPSWGSLNNAHIDDRTRYLWIPASHFYAGTATNFHLTPGSAPNAANALAFSGSADAHAYTNICLPADYVSGLTYKLYFIQRGGSSANAIIWYAYQKKLVVGTTLTSAAYDVLDKLTYTTNGGTDVVVTGSITSTLSSPAAGDVVRFTLSRLASTDAADTNTNTVDLLGIRLEYTADM